MDLLSLVLGIFFGFFLFECSFACDILAHVFVAFVLFFLHIHFFFSFSTADEALKAVQVGQHVIDGRSVRTDLAWRGRKQGNQKKNQNNMQNQRNNMQHNMNNNNYNNNNNNNFGGGGFQNNNRFGGGGGNFGGQRRGPGHGAPKTIAQGSIGPVEQRRLFVASLAYHTTDDKLRQEFARHGELEEAVIIKDKNNNMRSKGYGFVIYRTPEAAQAALTQPTRMIDGRQVCEKSKICHVFSAILRQQKDKFYLHFALLFIFFLFCFLCLKMEHK